MNPYIILLRGVMPVGKNKVPMARLREVLSGNGFGDVSTYIQSGNVLLNSSLSPEKIEEKVSQLIKQHIGADLVVVTRTSPQINKILKGNPFKDDDISRVFFCVFKNTPEKKKVNELLEIDFSPEKLVIKKDWAYMFIPGNAARSKLSNNYLEKKLGIPATTRNFNTLSKLIELCKN